MRIVARRLHQLLTNSHLRYAIPVKTNSLASKDLLGCRYFSQKTGEFVKLKHKEFHVNPGFGVFRTNGNVDCLIKPTNPQEYPDADRAFINVYGRSSTSCKDVNIELAGESQDVLMLTAFPESTDMYCEVHIPIKYDLDLKFFNEASVQITGMEANEVNIQTHTGNIDTKGLRSHNIHINTKMGNITAEGTLQGNIFINAKKTRLTAKRLQGMAMSIDAEELDTAIESSYVNQGEITAHRGNICLKNLHGCTDLVLRNGQVSISGLHGQIAGFLGKGSMDVQVTDVTSNSTLHLNEGTMRIAVLEDPRHSLEVNAPSLEIAEQLKSKGAHSVGILQSFDITKSEDPFTNKLIATVVRGTARLTCQDWFSTLGIKSG